MIRVVFQDIEAIRQHLLRETGRRGDRTDLEKEEYKRAVLAREADLPLTSFPAKIDTGLVTLLHVDFIFGYSLKHGEYTEIVAYITLRSSELKRTLAQQAHKLVDSFLEQGLQAVAPDSYGVREIRLSPAPTIV